MPARGDTAHRKTIKFENDKMQIALTGESSKIDRETYKHTYNEKEREKRTKIENKRHKKWQAKKME